MHGCVRMACELQVAAHAILCGMRCHPLQVLINASVCMEGVVHVRYVCGFARQSGAAKYYKGMTSFRSSAKKRLTAPALHALPCGAAIIITL